MYRWVSKGKNKNKTVDTGSRRQAKLNYLCDSDCPSPIPNNNFSVQWPEMKNPAIGKKRAKARRREEDPVRSTTWVTISGL